MEPVAASDRVAAMSSLLLPQLMLRLTRSMRLMVVPAGEMRSTITSERQLCAMPSETCTSAMTPASGTVMVLVTGVAEVNVLQSPPIASGIATGVVFVYVTGAAEADAGAPTTTRARARTATVGTTRARRVGR